jgi:CspA family cold shock protein|tara:strand:- start:3070 stop:3276 length:207 start_codon:yes stop_codon:yes gene_type:complete
MKGKVKFFNRTKGFGFIAAEAEGDKPGQEVFVHETGITSGPIDENDEVEFDLEEGDKGPKAVNVKKLG